MHKTWSCNAPSTESAKKWFYCGLHIFKRESCETSQNLQNNVSHSSKIDTELQHRMTKRSLPSRWPSSLCTLREVTTSLTLYPRRPKCALLGELGRTISPFFTCAVMQLHTQLMRLIPVLRSFSPESKGSPYQPSAKLQFWKVAFRVTSLELHRTGK